MRSAASTRRISSKLRNPDALAPPAGVDGRGRLGKHPGVHAADFDLGAKAGGTS